jgi:hypothetical protein
MRRLAMLTLGVLLGGCASPAPRCLATLCVGNDIDPAAPPALVGYDLVGGLCGGQTVLPSNRGLASCNRANAHAVIYRDRTWQYGLMLTNGEITSVERSSRDGYP